MQQEKAVATTRLEGHGGGESVPLDGVFHSMVDHVNGFIFTTLTSIVSLAMVSCQNIRTNEPLSMF